MKTCLALAAASALALTGCGGATEDEGGSAGSAETLEVVTSFYPLEYAIERVGGDGVAVTNLTKPGAEPHSLELTPQDVLTVSRSDAFVYLSDFQPAVDDVVDEADHPFDVSEAARLDLEAADGHDHAGDEEEHAHEDGHDHGASDPHFWLDPMRYADVGDAIAGELARRSPDHEADFTKRAADLRSDLEALHEEFTAGLASCQHTELVTSHSAFGYLADAYGLHQESITGISPETEPSSAAMATAVEHIKEHDVRTIYAEPLLPTDVADTIARETGASVRTLDPIGALTAETQGQDYFEIMRANRATLEAGQECG